MKTMYRFSRGMSPRVLSSICPSNEDPSLHAAVRVPQGRPDRLEHLIRYVARPPIANDRLAILPDGRIAYTFKKRWRDGSAAVVFDPLTFLERLAALVPRPRTKLGNDFGVFAPAASIATAGRLFACFGRAAAAMRTTTRRPARPGQRRIRVTASRARRRTGPRREQAFQAPLPRRPPRPEKAASTPNVLPVV